MAEEVGTEDVVGVLVRVSVCDDALVNEPVGVLDPGEGVPDGDAVGPEDELGVGVGDFITATLRLYMVALATPASLASQE